MKNKKKDYLANEMKSYNYIMEMFVDRLNYYLNKVTTLERRKQELEKELDEFGYSSPLGRLDIVRTMPAPKSNRIIEIMSSIDDINKRLVEIDSIRYKEVLPLCDRIDYVDEGLAKLDSLQKQFMIDLYIQKKGVRYMMEHYQIEYSQDIYRTASRYLGYMIYGKNHRKK